MAGIRLLLLLFVVFGSGKSHAQDDPKWAVAPYLWGPSISLDTSSDGWPLTL